MADRLYTGFQRIANVYTGDYSQLRFTLPQSIWGKTSFSLLAEGGCSKASMELAPADINGAAIINAPFLLNIGDIVQFLPEAGIVWYTGAITGRSKTFSNKSGPRHNYTLDGLSSRVQGIPITETTDTISFGKSAPAGQHPEIYYPSDATAGLIEWLFYNVVAHETYGLITDTTDINRTAMQYGENYKIDLLQVGSCDDVAGLISQMAMMVVDANYAAPLNRKCYWGVNAARRFYFGFRPDLKLASIDFNVSGNPIFTVGSETMQYESIGMEDSDCIYNCLHLAGSTPDGATESQGIQKYYKDSASIAKYFRRRLEKAQDLPNARSVADLDKFAPNFFSRYADPKPNCPVSKVPIFAAHQLIQPEKGYVQIIDSINPFGTEPAGRRDILSIEVEFDATPIMSITLSDINEGMYGNGTSPGSAYHDARNKEAKQNVSRSAGSSVTQYVILTPHNHSGFLDGGPAIEN